MSQKKVLILGASGFIGYNIFERLKKRKDLEVIGTYHSNRYGRCRPIGDYHLLRVDLTNKKEVYHITKNVDLIIQAAGTTSGIKDTVNNPAFQITDNALMNPLIFEYAHLNGVPQVIFFGTSIVYPPHADRPLAETDVDLNGFAPKYFGASWTKIYLEKLCEFYAGLGRTKYTVIRPANLYGPYDRFDLEHSHVLPALVNKVMNARDGKITLWGNGQEKKDLLYISDLVDCVELVMEKQTKPFDIFNAGSGELISVKELAQKIITLSGQSLKMEFDSNGPSISASILLDSTKAQTELGWRRQIGLTEGLIRTIDWFKENIQRKRKVEEDSCGH